MSDSIIVVENLSKRYLVGHRSKQRERYAALRDVISREARTFARKAGDFVRGRQIIEGDEVEELWALQDVNFELKRGEVLGIIGRNGAGKSTLLKILSKITEPDRGRAILRGRTASLLEVGTGFHPELTGRENIYLNGSILGMTRAEIKSKFDEIVSFAEVDNFLDTPVKHFSSGMGVRLAFAVAAHLEPEILIIDEVLAVGDANFQKKCLGKIHDLSTEQGRTVLFVSHNMAAIQTYCGRALLLDRGRTRGIGDVDGEIKAYTESSSQSVRACERRKLSLLTLDSLLVTPNRVVSGTSLSYALQLSSTEPTKLATIDIHLCSSFGVRIALLDLRTTRFDYRIGPDRPLKLRGRIHSLPLVEGEYSLGVYADCGDLQEHVYEVVSITVTHASRNNELAPYSPNHRGFLELSHEFNLE